MTIIILAATAAILVLAQISIKENIELRHKIANAKENIHTDEKTLQKHLEEIKALDAAMADKERFCCDQHKEMLASVRMAKRIQTAAFTQEKELHGVFPESFIFTKVHSIVSGDFYKAAEIEHFRIFALADCAGFGIPGGFLSMLGIAMLNEQLAIHYHDTEIDLPAMLSEMREQVITALKTDNIENVNDGMNMTLCAFSKHENKLYFAGADQNLYICHEGQVREIKGNKYPIGWYIKGNLPFTQHEEQITPGDMVYIPTDSLQSQFGGPNGTKFTAKRMIQMFSELHPKPAPMQHSIVHDTVHNWMQGHKQVDDLTVAGVRV